MATDNQAQAAMEDILSSIRSGVEEEGSKVGTGSADLIDAAAEADGDEDVLELSATDMVAAPVNAGGEELIDIAAFAASGTEKPADAASMSDLAAELLGEGVGVPAAVAAEAPVDVPAEAVAPAADGGASDEFDRLLAEISQEQQQNVAAAEVSKQALMEEEVPLGAEAAEVVADASAAVEPEMVVEAPVAVAPVASMPVNGAHYNLSTVEGSEGVQIALPAEVLALALRPMVQDWLQKNLPAVVEQLVKEEISKLTQN